jgi:hypothetical protein
LWSAGEVISAEEIRGSLLLARGPGEEAILGRPLGDGFKLTELLDRVAKHYLERALAEAQGNKTKAADPGRPRELPDPHELAAHLPGESVIAAETSRPAVATGPAVPLSSAPAPWHAA